MKVIKYGESIYKVYSQSELESIGYVINPYLCPAYLWMHCIVCKTYYYHKGMSSVDRDNWAEFRVCSNCNNGTINGYCY